MDDEKKVKLKNKEDFKNLSRAEDDGFPIAKIYKKDIVDICKAENKTQDK